MSAAEVVHSEVLAERVTAEVIEQPGAGGALRLKCVSITCVFRPRVPILAYLSQIFALVCCWGASSAVFPASSRAGELVARVVIAGIGLLASYLGLVELLNRTSVILDAGCLSVRQGPLPWPGSRTISVAEIVAARAEEQGGEAPAYQVRVVTRLREYSVLGGLRRAEEARRVAEFLEAAIRRWQRERASS